MKTPRLEEQRGETPRQLSTARASLTDRKYVVPFILITTLFFLWGFARAILDVLNKHFQNEFSISITQSSLIQVTTYLGYFLMAIPAGIFINKYGYRKGVVFGLLLFGIGALLFIPGSAWGTFNAFLGALFVIGCGLVFLETSANPYVTELGDKSTATSRLNLSQSFNGLGSLFATFVVGQFLFGDSIEGGDVAVPYAILGVLVLMIAVVFAKVRLPEISHGEGPASGGGLWSDIRELGQHKVFVFGLIALLAYEVSEISINSYFINFVTGQGWMDDNVAAVVLTCALAFFMIGRFLGSWIMRYVRPECLLFICAVGSVSCLSLVLLDIRIVSLVALIANYLFEAIMFPTIFSLALMGLGRLTKSASALLMMTPIGGCGFLLMGLIADNVSVVAPFLVPLDGFIIVLLYAYKLLKHHRECAA
uniref:L-fucose:H+ symporter permease n=1 Tax=Prevotella sp. GTC17253 TaxID=3236793 RepID=A0AB33IW36_9BACT